MAKRVLLVCVPFMSLYEDVAGELKNQGYEVVYLEDRARGRDFYSNRFDNQQILRKFQSVINQRYWRRQLKNLSSLYFDYVIVIDGFTCVESKLIDTLRNHNPKIRSILYLFDKTYKSFRFDLMFKHFDKVYTFDIDDSKRYKIKLLPIYWTSTEFQSIEHDIFGFGTYLPNRYELFNYAANITRKLGLKSYIMLYWPVIKNGLFDRLKSKFRKALIPANIYNSDIVTHFRISPEDYRRMIISSNIILDSHDVVQDGLTARFMWAIGLGKKIITTNRAIVNYSFYDSNQVRFFDNANSIIDDEFFKSPYVQSEKQKEELIKFRIDNWVKELLDS